MKSISIGGVNKHHSNQTNDESNSVGCRSVTAAIFCSAATAAACSRSLCYCFCCWSAISASSSRSRCCSYLHCHCCFLLTFLLLLCCNCCLFKHSLLLLAVAVIDPQYLLPVAAAASRIFCYATTAAYSCPRCCWWAAISFFNWYRIKLFVNKWIKSISIGGVAKHHSNQTNDESNFKRCVEKSSNRNFE